MSMFSDDDSEEYMPMPAMRGRARSSFIPLTQLQAGQSMPGSFAQPIIPDMTPPTPPPAPKERPSEFNSLVEQAVKQFGAKEEKEDKPKTLSELLAAAGYAPPAADKAPTIPGEVAAAQAKVLDPTQAPDGTEVQVDMNGVPTTYFAKNRQGESGGDDRAVNKTTGAAGRYQFMPSTAEGLIKANPHLNISANWRTNPADQEKLMQAYTQQSVNALRPILKRDPTGGELYMTHLLGHGGGPHVLQNLDLPLTQTVSAAAIAANPILQKFKTGRELLAYFNKNF